MFGCALELESLCQIGRTDAQCGIYLQLENVDLLDDLEAGSLDDYVRLRSVYTQQRASELGEAVGVKVEPEVVTESAQ